MKRLSLEIDDETHLAFTVYCAKKRKKMTQVLRDSIEQVLRSDSEKIGRGEDE